MFSSYIYELICSWFLSRRHDRWWCTFFNDFAYFGSFRPFLALFCACMHCCVLFTGPNSLVVYKKLKNIRYGSPPSASRGCGEECLCLQYTLSPLLHRTRENTTLFPIVLSIVLHGIVHCCAHCCSLFCFLLSIISYGQSCVTGVQNFLYQEISASSISHAGIFLARVLYSHGKVWWYVMMSMNTTIATVARYPSPFIEFLHENKRYEK